MTGTISKEFLTDTGMRRDWVDLRDQNYRPNLTVLPNERRLDTDLTLPLEAVPDDYPTKQLPVPGEPALPSPPKLNWRSPSFGVRHQGSSGRCVGYALANLIDIQRNLQRLDVSRSAVEAKKDIVSADMLYRMAFFHDRYPDPGDDTDSIGEGVRTLRAAIKGFYHHGACRDWPDRNSEPEDGTWQSEGINRNSVHKAMRFPSVTQAKKAREIGLGAYYRLSSILNHFHAAIKDAGAILCSAKVHDGWLKAKPQTGGFITWPPEVGAQGIHAFVITGYDRYGFHVLNSWGDIWGGYEGQAGIGLWTYGDWAQNVVDAWVLRMGVFAPMAFGASIGEQGTKGVTGPARSGSTPCLELVGHYMHLDDGYHVSIGAYPSFPKDWSKTNDYLKENLSSPALKKTGVAPEDKEKTKPYRGILVWIPGSLEGIKPAFTAAVKRKNAIKDLGLYPYTIFWCNNFVEKSLEVLQTIFASCEAQVGGDAEHLDDLIEQRVQGVGRAFWRDIELSARRSVRGPTELPYETDDPDAVEYVGDGYVGLFLSRIKELKEQTGCEVHIVAEGAGALVFHEMLSFLQEEDKPIADVAELFDSVHLVHAAIGLPRAEKRIIPLFRHLNGEDSGPSRRKFAEEPLVEKLKKHPLAPRARLYVPTKELEEHVNFGSYGGSILHLVSRAFEDRKLAPEIPKDEEFPPHRQARPFLGMAKTADYRKSELKGAIYCLNRLLCQPNGRTPVSQSQLVEDPTITNHIFEGIERLRST